MRLIALIPAFLALGVVSCRNSPVVIDGKHGVFSPDGKRIAFEREIDGRVAVGVCELGSQRIVWIRDDHGNACHPCWTPDGKIVFSCGFGPETSFAAVKSKSTAGQNLYLWENGRITPITHGRFFDWSPEVSSDGKALYFSTSRGQAGGQNLCSSNLARLRLDGTDGSARSPELVITSSTSNSGVCDARVSPDGRLLVRAVSYGFDSSGWQVVVSRADNPNRFLVLNDEKTYAYSPRWSADGRSVFFTGYHPGDPTWCIYEQDLATGLTRNLGPGRDACPSPDGRRIVLERDGKLFVERLDDLRTYDKSQSAIDHSTNRRIEKSILHVVSATVDYRPTPETAKSIRHVLYQVSQDSDQALQLYLNEKDGVVFATRDSELRYSAAGPTQPLAPGRHVLVGIASRSQLQLFVDGVLMATKVSPTGKFMELRGLRELAVGRRPDWVRGKPFPGTIENVRSVTGLPSDLDALKPLTRAELVGKEVR